MRAGLRVNHRRPEKDRQKSRSVGKSSHRRAVRTTDDGRVEVRIEAPGGRPRIIIDAGGVVLNSRQARALAERLLELAERVG